MAVGKILLEKYFKGVSSLDYYSPGSLPFGCPMPKYYQVCIGPYEIKLVQAKMGNKNFLTMKVGMSLVKEWESRTAEQLENDIQSARSIIVSAGRDMLKTLGESLDET